MADIMDDAKINFFRGVAISAAFLIKYHNEELLAHDMLQEFGITYKMLVDADVDEYDLEEIRKLSDIE